MKKWTNFLIALGVGTYFCLRMDKVIGGAAPWKLRWAKMKWRRANRQRGASVA